MKTRLTLSKLREELELSSEKERQAILGVEVLADYAIFTVRNI